MDADASAALARRARHEGATIVARSRAQPGEEIELTVDLERIHFFDPDTGLAIGDQD